MKATIDIPEPIARRIGALAARNGRDVTDQIVQVLRILLSGDASVEEWESILRASDAGNMPDVVIRTPHHGRTSIFIHLKRASDALPAPVFSVDPVTGMPVINSPPDAPIHRMTAAEFQTVIDQANEEAELERAGIPVRR